MNNVKIFFIIFLLSTSTIVSATIIHVPDEQPTIQAGIDAAMNGDIVLVADGTYTGTGNRDIDFNGKAITVKSANGPDDCVIDCQGSAAHPHRGFNFHNSEGEDSILWGFTITNGYANGFTMVTGSGGGILCNLSSPKIENNIIVGNTSNFYGGGISCVAVSSTINQNVISEDYGSSHGGGIHCKDLDCTPRITLNTIINNVTGEGGGIFCDESNPTISNNLISQNIAGRGGGILCRYTSNPLIINNIISNNTATSGSDGGGGIYVYNSSPKIINNHIIRNISFRGGGIYFRYSSLYIKNNIIWKNTSASYGGGIACYEQSSFNIISNIISQNEASEGGGIYSERRLTPKSFIKNNLICENLADFGGGIYCLWNSSPEISNNTIYRNSATSHGGGIYCKRNASPVIHNTIFWDNDGLTGNEIYLAYETGYPSSLTIDYSTVRGGLSSVYVGLNCTLNWGAGMIDADPLFVSGPLGKYYLSQLAAGQSQNSPCLDAGDGVITWPCHSHSVCGTTRTDLVPDSGIIDMGYHYPLVGIQIPPGQTLEEIPGE